MIYLNMKSWYNKLLGTVNIVNKYNNTYSTIKMKPVDVKSSTFEMKLIKVVIRKAINLKLII